MHRNKTEKLIRENIFDTSEKEIYVCKGYKLVIQMGSDKQSMITCLQNAFEVLWMRKYMYLHIYLI